jgi:hypothetical protein
VVRDAAARKRSTRQPRGAGVAEVTRRDASVASLFFWVVSLGRARPFVVVGRKAAAA